METYQVRMLYEETRNIRALTPEEAALEYAEWAYYEIDMDDHDDYWRDEYSIIVTDSKVIESIWHIEVDTSPGFKAIKV